MKIVREAAVSAIETPAKIKNWSPRLLMPIKPVNAAASAPIPNQSSTKPELNTSATMRIKPSTHQRIQIRLSMFALAFKQIAHHKPDVCRALSQPAHKVRIPVFAIRHIDAHVITVARQPGLQVAANAIE